jgi:hypothetical protein
VTAGYNRRTFQHQRTRGRSLPGEPACGKIRLNF